MKKQTKFGIDQINNPTPAKAKMIFKIIVLLTSVLGIVLPQTSLLSIGQKAELNIWLGAVDAFVLGLTQLFGETTSKS